MSKKNSSLVICDRKQLTEILIVTGLCFRVKNTTLTILRCNDKELVLEACYTINIDTPLKNDLILIINAYRKHRITFS